MELEFLTRMVIAASIFAVSVNLGYSMDMKSKTNYPPIIFWGLGMASGGAMIMALLY